MNADPIVVASAVRTPMGGLQGDLKSFTAPQLGAVAIRAAVERSGVQSMAVDQVLMGNVLSAGTGQAPARQAALGAGLETRVTCTTLNKMCGSGMQAVLLAHDLLLADSASVVVAGGMESMSNAPYLLEKARAGYRLGHGRLLDHMFVDGLEDAYDPGSLMGSFAEDCAQALGLSRAAQDEFAGASLARSLKAAASGAFDNEIVPLQVPEGKGLRWVSSDEQPPKADAGRIAQLRPVFREGGTVTAANSSSISDGAAALVLMRRSEAQRRGLTVLAIIRGHTAFAGAPGAFPTAPIGAIRRLQERTGWSLGDVDRFEINEAFAVVTLAAMAQLDLPHAKVNVHGGACALGHPIGASGARIIATLIWALRRQRLSRGIAAICIGGGEATAIAIECVY